MCVLLLALQTAGFAFGLYAGVVRLAGGGDEPGLAAALGVVGEDAVLDEPDPGQVQLAVDVVADEAW